VVNLNLNQFKESLSNFEKAIELSPWEASYFAARGNYICLALLTIPGTVFFRMSDFFSALKDIEKAISLDPEKSDYYHWKGMPPSSRLPPSTSNLPPTTSSIS
jgi:tetratricopeptide (TPR) repeat protein